MYAFFSLFILFTIYSVLGFFLEITVCSINNKKLTINRGFLIGPYLPIFGTGAVLVTLLLSNYKEDYLIVFFLGMLICSTIEYFTSLLLEKYFHNKWWDYSNHIDNINGRITLSNSVGFGVGSVLIVNILNPLFYDFISYFDHSLIIIIGLLLIIIILADTMYSVMVAYALRNRIIVVEELKAEKIAMVPEVIKNYIANKLGAFKATSDRLLKLFPDLNNEDEIKLVRDVVIELKEEKKSRRKK